MTCRVGHKLLKIAGVSSPDSIYNFITRCLSPEVNSRPQSVGSKRRPKSPSEHPRLLAQLPRSPGYFVTMTSCPLPSGAQCNRASRPGQARPCQTKRLYQCHILPESAEKYVRNLHFLCVSQMSRLSFPSDMPLNSIHFLLSPPPFFELPPPPPPCPPDCPLWLAPSLLALAAFEARLANSS